MIDLHCHLLPGIDDGPRDIDGSLKMARRAVREGIRTVIATPHVNSRYPNTTAGIAAGVEEIRAALADENVPIEVLPGAEIAVNYLAESEIADLGALSLA